MVRQGSAKPSSPVQIRVPPPKIVDHESIDSSAGVAEW